MEFVVSLAAKVVSPLVTCWKHHTGINESMCLLQQKLEELYSRKHDITARLDIERREGKAIREEVQRWLLSVERISEEIKVITAKAENVKLFSRAALTKNILRKTEEVKELYSHGGFLDGLVIQLPRRAEIMPMTTTLGGETTTRRKAEEIWACLMDDEVTKIGVYGMGGVGKTTLVKHIYNLLLERKDRFRNVIWITVSKYFNIVKLQDQIASNLGLYISRYDDKVGRAAMLYDRLSREESYVLILDDLWDIYSLAEIGIPEPTPQNGSKLVLTTRSLEVCRFMGCRPIPIELLSHAEALNLFLDTVGRDPLSNPDRAELMDGIVRECAGLPLAIVTIAGSLNGVVDSHEWMIALKELKESGNESIMSDEIYKRIKFSYDRLNDLRLQSCLLYCALYPEGYEIERGSLIAHLIAEGIIEERRTRQSEILRGYVMLNKLVRSSLLEDITNSQGEPCVVMHDLIRDMTLQIASERPRYLIKAGAGLRTIPDKIMWEEDLAKVSLMSNDIFDIPSVTEHPNCPRLSTLLLSKNSNLRRISNDFFLHMKGLIVLDVSETGIENLPGSVSELVNLTALFARRCEKLKNVPSLEKLRDLRTLDFFGSGINDVPQGVEMLVELRYLNLDAKHLKMISDGILCKLSNLRYLSLNHHGEAPTVRAEELETLRNLETFGGVLHDINSFNAYVRSFKQLGLTSYLLQLGTTDYFWFTPVLEANKIVFLANWDSEKVAADGSECPLLLPEDVEILRIQRCNVNVNNLCELALFEKVVNLRECIIADCEKIEHVFSYSSSISSLLQSLEELHLVRLPDLRGLIRQEREALSPLPTGTFSSLKCLTMAGCNRIKKLFMTASLPNLEKLELRGCVELEEIISATYNEDDCEDQDKDRKADHHASDINVVLPKLKKVLLESLPKLQGLPVVADFLQEIEIRGCPELRKIPILDGAPSSSSLIHVHIDDVSWEALEWNHPSAKDAVQSLRK